MASQCFGPNFNLQPFLIKLLLMSSHSFAPMCHPELQLFGTSCNSFNTPRHWIALFPAPAALKQSPPWGSFL